MCLCVLVLNIMPQAFAYHPLYSKYLDKTGVLVRKDRWERAVRDIATAMGYSSRGGFEIDCLVASVEQLVANANDAGVPVQASDELPQ